MRWYSPALGQFLTPDPLGEVDGWNLHAYVDGDPINRWDPWGLDASSMANAVLDGESSLDSGGEPPPDSAGPGQCRSIGGCRVLDYRHVKVWGEPPGRDTPESKARVRAAMTGIIVVAISLSPVGVVTDIADIAKSCFGGGDGCAMAVVGALPGIGAVGDIVKAGGKLAGAGGKAAAAALGAAGEAGGTAAKAARRGAKRGPKTDPNAPHNAKIRDEANTLEAEGNTIVAGGGRAKERVINTPGGTKGGRRPDILYETPDGTLRGRNVGETRADGTPVKREIEALEDLNGPGDLPTDFVLYDR